MVCFICTDGNATTLPGYMCFNKRFLVLPPYWTWGRFCLLSYPLGSALWAMGDHLLLENCIFNFKLTWKLHFQVKGDLQSMTTILRIYYFVISRNPSTCALVTTGDGKFFSNGLDLRLRTVIPQQEWVEFLGSASSLLKRLATFPVPTVAAINGRLQSETCMA